MTAFHSHNSTLHYYDTDWVAVGGIESIGISASASVIDVTNLSSENNTRVFQQGLADPGELSLSVQLDPDDTAHKFLQSKLFDKASAATNFKITFSDDGSTLYTFGGFVTSFDISVDMDDKVMADLSIKISGKPTYDA